MPGSQVSGKRVLNPHGTLMNPIERSAKLKKEADELLEAIKLKERCSSIGELTPTGSYYLDLMIYPDIDLYLPPAKPRQLFQLAADLVENYPVVRVNFLNGGQGPLRNGLYIKPVIGIGDWERPWKIDIWAITQSFIDEKIAELDRFKAKITLEQRERILNYKFAVLNKQGRTPHFSGYYIYRAVIDLGMQSYDDITTYLKQNAIDV